MRAEPGQDRFGGAIWQEIKGSSCLDVDQNRSVAVSTSQRSGKGNGVTTIPSPKNRTGDFRRTRLKPLISPVLPDAVSPRVNPGYELADDRWDEATPGFLPDLILLLIAREHDGCAIP